MRLLPGPWRRLGDEAGQLDTSGGSKRVTLTVTDNDGGIASLAQDVYVCFPGAETDALLTPKHVRLEVEGCVHVNAGDLPV